MKKLDEFNEDNVQEGLELLAEFAKDKGIVVRALVEHLDACVYADEFITMNS